MNLLSILDGYKPYEDIKKEINKGGRVSVSGIVESAQPQLIGALSQGKSALVVVYNETEAKALQKEIELYRSDVYVLLDKEYIFYNIDAKNHTRELERISALDKLLNGGVVIASLEACCSYTLPPSTYKAFALDIKVDDTIEIDDLTKHLVTLGYKAEDMTEGEGQFSQRGGILDVYTPNLDMPVRIEFFDNIIDSIRLFDPAEQRSKESIESVRILPVSETVIDENRRSKLVSYLTMESKKKKCRDELLEVLAREIEKLNEGETLPEIDKYAGVIYDEIPTVCDYLPEDGIVVIVEPKRLNERSKTFEWDQSEGMSERYGKTLPVGTPLPWQAYSNVTSKLSKHSLVSLNLLSHTSLDYTYTALSNFTSKTTVSLHGKLDYLYDDLSEWKKLGTTVVIFAGGELRGKNLEGTLKEKGYNAFYCDSITDIKEGSINLFKYKAKKGFEYPELKFVLVAEQDVFDVQKQKKVRKADSTKRIKAYTCWGLCGAPRTWNRSLFWYKEDGCSRCYEGLFPDKLSRQ